MCEAARHLDSLESCTTMSCVSDLLRIASEPEAAAAPVLDDHSVGLAGDLTSDLVGLLGQRNGFWAFESALHVLPAYTGADGIDLNRWNSPELWRHKYGALADGCLFFAEDAFGGQFCIYEGGIYTFDVETAEKKWIAENIERFVDILLGDYEFLTGYPLAHEWQVQNRPLAPGERLVPKTPFVLGGDFTVDNLRAMNAVSSMRMRGDIASQLKDLPEGAKVEIRVRE